MDIVGVLGPLEPYNETVFRPQPYVAPRNILRQHRSDIMINDACTLG